MAEDSVGEPIQALSKRQLELLELLAKGLTNEELAGVLGISPTTVRTHVTAILARLKVGNRHGDSGDGSILVGWRRTTPGSYRGLLRIAAMAPGCASTRDG